VNFKSRDSTPPIAQAVDSSCSKMADDEDDEIVVACCSALAVIFRLCFVV